MNKEQELYNMKIGDKIGLDVFDVWRVPNGWIFGIDMGETATIQFVPSDNEVITQGISDKEYRDLFK